MANWPLRAKMGDAWLFSCFSILECAMHFKEMPGIFCMNFVAIILYSTCYIFKGDLTNTHESSLAFHAHTCFRGAKVNIFSGQKDMSQWHCFQHAYGRHTADILCRAMQPPKCWDCSDLSIETHTPLCHMVPTFSLISLSHKDNGKPTEDRMSVSYAHVSNLLQHQRSCKSFPWLQLLFPFPHSPSAGKVAKKGSPGILFSNRAFLLPQ